MSRRPSLRNTVSRCDRRGHLPGDRPGGDALPGVDLHRQQPPVEVEPAGQQRGDRANGHGVARPVGGDRREPLGRARGHVQGGPGVAGGHRPGPLAEGGDQHGARPLVHAVELRQPGLRPVDLPRPGGAASRRPHARSARRRPRRCGSASGRNPTARGSRAPRRGSPARARRSRCRRAGRRSAGSTSAARRSSGTRRGTPGLPAPRRGWSAAPRGCPTPGTRTCGSRRTPGPGSVMISTPTSPTGPARCAAMTVCSSPGSGYSPNGNESHTRRVR